MLSTELFENCINWLTVLCVCLLESQWSKKRLQIKGKTVYILVKHTALWTKTYCGMSSFYVRRDLGERYNAKGTDSNVQLCCGFRQRRESC